MIKNKWLLLGLSVLSLFGLNGLANKNVEADATNNVITKQNNYQQRINQLTAVPKVQQNSQLKTPTPQPIHNNNNFKKNINSQISKLQSKIVDNDIKNTTIKAKGVVRHHNEHRSHHKYYYVSEAKKLTFQGQNNTDACEMASVKNILSIHHKAMNTSMNIMLNHLGWDKNWNHGYTGNPYTGHEVTISPWLEARLLRKYGVRAHVHNYISKRRAIRDLKQGLQFVVEAGHRCHSYHTNHTVSDHILDIVGIKRNRHGLFVQYIEPNTNRHPVAWCSFHRFWNSYNRPNITGNRLVVVGY